MDGANEQLRAIIMRIWPRTSEELLDKIVPKAEGMLWHSIIETRCRDGFTGRVWGGGVHPPQLWLGGCMGGAIFINKEEKITNNRQ